MNIFLKLSLYFLLIIFLHACGDDQTSIQTEKKLRTVRTITVGSIQQGIRVLFPVC